MNRHCTEGLELGDALKSGSTRALARLISYVENGRPEAEQALQYLYPQTGHAHILGVTGPAGSGKSSLVDRLTYEMRSEGYSVGILACDPTSPFTGGAILGDRLRMQSIANDREVFVRSLGTRGHLGGLSRATADAIHFLDAFGKDFIIVETVGAGQDEVDIAKLADTCIVVAVPGLGDEIQAIKAGIMEIGDIFVVNKADREGADLVVQEIKNMLNLKGDPRDWRIPVVKTIATQSQGINEVLGFIRGHREDMERTGELINRRKERCKTEVTLHMAEEIYRHIDQRIKEEVNFDKSLEEVLKRKKDPYSLSQELLWPITKHI